MIFTPQQNKARDMVRAWLRDKTQQVFRLFGYAGTGKTTLAKDLTADFSFGEVLFGAFTGKAADVLSKKGCPATTLHKLMYRVQEKSRKPLEQLEEQLASHIKALSEEMMARLGCVKVENIDHDKEVIRIRAAISDEMHGLKRPSWSLNEDSPIKDAKLMVIDEVSMVDGRMGDDVLSFGIPVLVLGDPFQLKPVAGEGFFTRDQPDVLLTDVQRNTDLTGVLRMATDIRMGKGLRLGAYGNSKVILQGDLKREEVLAADQIIVGRNKTRKNFNHRIRQLLGRDDPYPVKGDKLVCLRNDHNAGLLNGGLWEVRDSARLDDAIDMTVYSPEAEREIAVEAHHHYFLGDQPPFFMLKERQCFDYGYALTCHKSQGSEWKNPMVFDESWAFRKDAAQWLYTAVTRASGDVIVVKDFT